MLGASARLLRNGGERIERSGVTPGSSVTRAATLTCSVLPQDEGGRV